MKPAFARLGLVALPSGRLVDLHRPRSAGPLDTEELAACRRLGVALSYDPVQLGWVPASVTEDIDPADELGPIGTPERTDLPIAIGDRYRLRRWRQSDVPRFVALLDNPKVWEHLPETYPDPLTEDVARDLIELSNASLHHDVFVVELDGEPIGQVRLAFDPGSDDHSEGEISYWLGEPYWGRGIGRDLVTQFTALSFGRRPDLRSIVARVHKRNPASARILEKAGYVHGTITNDVNDVFILYRLARDGLLRARRGVEKLACWLTGLQFLSFAPPF